LNYRGKIEKGRVGEFKIVKMVNVYLCVVKSGYEIFNAL